MVLHATRRSLEILEKQEVVDILMAQPQFADPLLRSRRFRKLLKEAIVEIGWDDDDVLNLPGRTPLFVPNEDIQGVASKEGECSVDLTLGAGRPAMHRASLDGMEVSGQRLETKPAFIFTANDSGASLALRRWAQMPMNDHERMALILGSLAQGSTDLRWPNQRLRELRGGDFTQKAQSLDSHRDDVLNVEGLIAKQPELGFLKDNKNGGWRKFSKGDLLDPEYGKVYFASAADFGLRPADTTEACFARIPVDPTTVEIFMEVAGTSRGYNPAVDVVVLSDSAIVREFELNPNDPKNLPLIEELIRRQGVRGWHVLSQIRKLESVQVASEVETVPSTKKAGGWFSRLFGRS